MMREFKRLIDQHQHKIYTFAYYHLGNHEEAEDVTQEVLLRLWKNWQRIDAKRLLAWIIRVTKNACVDAIRKRQRYRTIVQGDKVEDAALGTISNELDPQTAAEVSDFHHHLQRALRSLSEPYRTVVILREIQDLKYQQISEALDLPLNSVKAYLHRGRQMLRLKLKGVVGYETNS